MFKKIIFLLLFLLCLASRIASAQYVDLSGTTGFIRQYVEESPENWNTPILFVFYNGNDYCQTCPKAISMIYDLYAQNFSDKMNIFEIDYSSDDEFNMRIAYELSQPLSIVVVRINDGLSRGYYKIDNPQDMIDDPFYFNENITERINNFLLQ